MEKRSENQKEPICVLQNVNTGSNLQEDGKQWLKDTANKIKQLKKRAAGKGQDGWAMAESTYLPF